MRCFQLSGQLFPCFLSLMTAFSRWRRICRQMAKISTKMKEYRKILLICSSSNKGAAVFCCRLDSLLLPDTELTWDTTGGRITAVFCRNVLKGPHLWFLWPMGKCSRDSRKMPHGAFCGVMIFRSGRSYFLYLSTFGLKPGFLEGLGISRYLIRPFRRDYTTSGEIVHGGGELVL